MIGDVIRQLLDLLTPSERRKAFVLFGMMLAMALFEAVGVASVVPFLSVLAQPDLIQKSSVVAATYRFSAQVGVDSLQEFRVALGAAMFALLVLSIAFKATTTYVQLRFIYRCEFELGRRLLDGYLQQPYTWYLNRHSTDLGRAVLSEVATVVNGALLPMLTVVSQGAVALALTALLFVVDPLVALSVSTTLAVVYGSIHLLARHRLRRIGGASHEHNRTRFAVVNDAFGAIKEIKVGSLEAVYLARFAKAGEAFSKLHTAAQSVAQLPRFALELVTFGGMTLLALVMLAANRDIFSALPVLVLYAFAGYRLMPALQTLSANFVMLRFSEPRLRALHADYSGLHVEPSQPAEGTGVIVVQHSIVLRDVGFRYPGADQPALQGVNVTIPARNTIGLVGATGSGKTTTVDLILGLLVPQEGSIEVDGHVIGPDNRRGWQRSIGYVPQQIFLSDDTIAANIAFGVDPQAVDLERVERAAKIANLHDFVVADLPNKYATTVGERGVRLSGGQRQRIGIARALYHNPSVLVLDEATSALDGLTEQAVMDAVNNLGHAITIIIIAHRLATVRNCDRIYLLERGRVVASGEFEALCRDNPSFQRMAGGA